MSEPLPLVGEVGAERRVRALASLGVSPRRHPLPYPLPQAGEGAHRLPAPRQLIDRIKSLIFSACGPSSLASLSR
ncbi:hypothetical protein EAS62_13905 [Bradyrhizobium zhanjiangense]|uniref:Uncharacterized protein n=1 Tax=Bradyrhizobium zhanjiangense TaxID=1325107 RepID=A0ABY0DM27_9BRAD|nr:hypothetical protein EAS62_13905 [Bradyrhizobium zhanjiangense]